MNLLTAVLSGAVWVLARLGLALLAALDAAGLTDRVDAIQDVKEMAIAYRTAVILGRDPDKPRNLAKSVTVE